MHRVDANIRSAESCRPRLQRLLTLAIGRFVVAQFPCSQKPFAAFRIVPFADVRFTDWKSRGKISLAPQIDYGELNGWVNHLLIPDLEIVIPYQFERVLAL